MHVNLSNFDKEAGAAFELRNDLNNIVEYIVINLDGDTATKFKKIKVIEFLMELYDGQARNIDWFLLDKKISEIMNRKVHII